MQNLEIHTRSHTAMAQLVINTHLHCTGIRLVFNGLSQTQTIIGTVVDTSPLTGGKGGRAATGTGAGLKGL